MRTNVRVGPIGRVFAPGYSWCKRCKTPWKFVREHITTYLRHESGSSGVFALCEFCWSELTPHERLPFYREVWDDWEQYPVQTSWSVMEAAVLNEGNDDA